MSGAEALGVTALESVVTAAVKDTYQFIKGLFASSNNLECINKSLSEDLETLLAIQKDNDSEVSRHKHKDTSRAYRLWKDRVSNIVPEVNQLRSKYEEERLAKWSLHRRSSLSEKMVQKQSQVKALIEGRPINILVDYKTPQTVLKVLDTPNIMEYPTLQSVLQKILGCLQNGQMKAIGVWGMKGVGKTTIMQNLNNSEEVSKLFDVVIFITVLADHKLQKAIADRLKVDSEGIKDNIDEVAGRIYEELKDKKYLLILDGVVDFVNLKQLGVPDNDNGSKVVMASQFLHVCNKNNMDELIEVERLQHDEAWKLFRHIVGPLIERPGISPTARRVCKRCSCLPLLIHKIGNAFKLKNDAPSWRAALEDLDDKWRQHQIDGLEEVYSFLTFCYDQLQDKHRKCFLYTSLYPAESKIYVDYLVECWAAQGFLGDDNKRMYQKARDLGRMIIWDLVDVSLLEKGEKMINVIINGCMRQLALYILSKHSRYKSYVHTTNEEFEEPQEPKTWPGATWVSIIGSELCDLPLSEDCHMLESLLLQKNSKLVTIPQTFFEKMSNLLVLDLYGTAIEKLPSSLSKLTGLKGLYLNACKHLSELPPEIKSLQLLEVLDIRGSQVSFIPSYIGSLANLRCLRIPCIKSSNRSDRQGVEAANYNVISKLHKLEELTIEVISHEEWFNQSENVIKQLALLRRLTTLSCSFPFSKIFTIFAVRRVQWRDYKQFTSFEVFIGWPNSEHPQILHYFEDGQAMGEVIHETDAFKLICYKDITKLSDLEIKSLNQVRCFLMKEGKKISTIVEGDKNTLIKRKQVAKFEATVLKEFFGSWNMFLGALVS